MPDPDATTARLAAKLYDAAADPASWDAALSQICRALGAEVGLLMVDASANRDAQLVSAMNWSDHALALYAVQYGRVDPYLAALRRAPPGTEVLLGHEAISPAQFERSEIWNEYSRDLVGAYHFLGASFDIGGPSAAGIGLSRPKDAAPFSDIEKHQLTGLVRHFEGALRVSFALDPLRIAGGLQAAALDSLSQALIVASAEGHTLYANRAAEDMARKAWLRLGDWRTRLAVGTGAQPEQLARLIHNAGTGGPGGSLRIDATPTRPALAATVTPLPAAVARSTVVGFVRKLPPALVVLRPLGGGTDLPAGMLMELFGLTAAEAAIVPALVMGRSAAEIAASRGVSPLTVRSQIRQILGKADAPSLRALAAIVLSL